MAYVIAPFVGFRRDEPLFSDILHLSDKRWLKGFAV